MKLESFFWEILRAHKFHFASVHGTTVLFHFHKCSLYNSCVFVDKHYSCMIYSKNTGLVCVSMDTYAFIDKQIKTKDVGK